MKMIEEDEFEVDNNDKKMMEFLSKQSMSTEQPQTTMTNIAPDINTNYWDLDNLPTKYRLYPDGCMISVRPLKVLDIKKLTSITADNADSVINDILRRCVRGIDIKDLYSVDKTYILFWLRANSFRDNKYVVDYVCDLCSNDADYHFTIDQLIIDYIKDDYDKDKEILLSSGDILKFKLTQISDELSNSSFITRFGHLLQDDVDSDLLSISSMISSINNKLVSEIDKYNYILSIDPEDLSTITTYLKSITVGIKPYMNISCNKCGGDTRLGISFLPEFFLPRDKSQ